MNIAEGFRRFVAPDFAHFLSYAVGSMEEAARRVQDGIDREYFTPEECQPALELARIAARTTTALQTSLRRLVQHSRSTKTQKRLTGPAWAKTTKPRSDEEAARTEDQEPSTED